MPRIRDLLVKRVTFGAVCVAGAMAWQASPSWAISDNVRNACMGDYFAYCSKHEVGSAGLRRCMHAAGAKLSKPCISALVAAGEVKVAYVERRSGKARKKPA